MDQRWADVMAQHHRDFLWLLGFQIATASGLLAAMARGFHWL
jgi:predicted outer membrane lipoprotein